MQLCNTLQTGLLTPSSYISNITYTINITSLHFHIKAFLKKYEQNYIHNHTIMIYKDKCFID